MMYKRYLTPAYCSKWQNLKVSWELERLFTHYERGMEAALADMEVDRTNAMYFCYVAPVMADLFNLYNKKITAFEVLVSAIIYLQETASRNPVGEQLLNDMLLIAEKTGIEVRTVIYKDNC